MMHWSDHLILLPIVLPLIVAAAMLLPSGEHRRIKSALSIATTLALVGIALTLTIFAMSGAPDGGDTAKVYALGDWPAPFGIVMVVDRLSAMMLLLTSVLGFCTLLFALVRWDRAGPRFYSLFLLLLMGVNGAFLTGDLFNLFVFFEVMLAASYGLVLHGSGEPRIRAGLHYIAINLLASTFFLIGVSLIYGVAGTLNMADLAARIAEIPPADRPLLEAGAAILGTAFLIKAGMWPLGFWLPNTYAAASAPAAAMFAIMSKVGGYAIVRLSLLVFGSQGGDSAGFGSSWLLVGGIATIGYGTVGILGTRELARAAGYVLLISSGTMIAVVGTGSTPALSGALFYMVGSTFAAASLFLLAGILERSRKGAATAADPVFNDEYHDPFENHDIEEVGVVIPPAVATLGVCFVICSLLVAGVPPFAGFIGKFAIFNALLPPDEPAGMAAWAVIAVLTFSSLGLLIALVRLGVSLLWIPGETGDLAAWPTELAALGALLVCALALTLWGGAALHYVEQTSAWLNSPTGYIRAVLLGAP
jgi:multicomponent K+:H+ antiporter subunit D